MLPQTWELSPFPEIPPIMRDHPVVVSETFTPATPSPPGVVNADPIEQNVNQLILVINVPPPDIPLPAPNALHATLLHSFFGNSLVHPDEDEVI